jgi:hypothetical protein
MLCASVASLTFTLAHMETPSPAHMETPLPSSSSLCSDDCTHCPRDKALPGNMSLLLNHHRASKNLARWQHEAKCRQRVAQRRPPIKAPAIALCTASTSNVVDQSTWAEKVEHSISFAELVVISTISRDVSDITHSLRLTPTLANASAHCLRKLSLQHVLGEGEEWRCRLSTREDAWKTSPASPTSEVVVHRTAHKGGLTFNVSLVWGDFDAQPTKPGMVALTEARWAELTMTMQAGCLTAIEAYESRSRARAGSSQIDMIVLLRADVSWLPGFTPQDIMAPAWAHFACAQSPTVLLPDVGDGGFGYNDRMAIMNRAAGPAYLRRGWLLAHFEHFAAHEMQNTSRSIRSKLWTGPHQIYARSSEQIMKAALAIEQITVHRFPNVAAVSCCSSRRATCRMPICYATCSRPRRHTAGGLSLSKNASVQPTYQASLFSRVLYEGLLTTMYEDALVSGQSRLAARSGCGAEVRLPCADRAPWSSEALQHPHTYAFCVHPNPTHGVFNEVTKVAKRHVKHVSKDHTKRSDAAVPGVSCQCAYSDLGRERDSMTGRCLTTGTRSAE